MVYLMLNEFKKMKNKSRFLVVFVIMFLMSILLVYTSEKNTNSEKTRLYSEVKNIKFQVSSTNERKQKAEANYARSKSEKYKDLVFNLNSQLEILEKQREELVNLEKPGSDWRVILEKDVELIKEKKHLAEQEGVKAVIENINKELMYKEFHLKNQVRYVEKQKSAFYNFPSILYYMQRLFLLVIISILVLDIVSGEYEASTIKVLLAKPVSRRKVLFSKFFTCILASNGIVLAMQGFAFLIFGMFFSFGNPETPFIVGTKYSLDAALLNQGARGIVEVVGSSSVLPAWEVILQLLLLQILLVTACVSLCVLISTIFKSNVVTAGVGFFSLIATWIIAFNATDTFNQISGRPTFIQKIVPYFFGSYYDLYALLTGTFSENLLNPNANVQTFVIVCIAWIIVCYGVAHVIFTKRDVL